MLFISSQKLLSFSRYLNLCSHFLVVWQNGLIRKIRFISKFITNFFPKTSAMEQRSERTDELGSEKDVGEGSYLQRFKSGRRISQSYITSREKWWGNRPVINLRNLNKFVPYQHLKVESLHFLKRLLQSEDYMCKIDLKDAYFSVPLSKESWKLLRIQWEEACMSSIASVLH